MDRRVIPAGPEATSGPVRFSICIPNHNYARYLNATIRSALDQEGPLEVLVSDNASTDGSAAVVGAIADERITIQVNNVNVGFAANLDRAVAMGSGEWVILLSSDDLMEPTALKCYRSIIDALGEAAARTVMASGTYLIDGDGRRTMERGPRPFAWDSATRRPDLEGISGMRVFEMPAAELLRRSILTMRNPFDFVSVAYPRALWKEVEGYRGGRFYNPDKDFHWRLMGVADRAIHVDGPLFSYRVHDRNQDGQQRRSGALKFLVDEYAYTFDVDEALLNRAGLHREDLVRAFIHEDVVLRGLDALGRGDRVLARRSVRLGQATYGGELARDPKAWLLRGLLALGPLGVSVARMARHRVLARRPTEHRALRD